MPESHVVSADARRAEPLGITECGGRKPASEGGQGGQQSHLALQE